MLKKIKAFFVENEDKPLPEPAPARAAVNVFDVYQVPRPHFSEIIIDFLDDEGREKLFEDFIQPPLLIQFKKIFFQAVYQVDYIEEELRLEAMQQLHDIYSYHRSIDVSKVKSKYKETFKASLRSDEFATRVFSSEYVPSHTKMNELIELVKNGGTIERPVKRMPKVLWDDERGYYFEDESVLRIEEDNISGTARQNGTTSEERRQLLEKGRVGTSRRRDGGNENPGGFGPI